MLIVLVSNKGRGYISVCCVVCQAGLAIKCLLSAVCQSRHLALYFALNNPITESGQTIRSQHSSSQVN